MQYTALIIICFSCFFIRINTNENCCATLYTDGKLRTLTLHKLGEEYKRLKIKQRKGCVACDQFTRSGLYKVMHQMQRKLPGTDSLSVIRHFGKPDKTEDGKIIYQWRGMRDYIWIRFSGRKVAECEWYLAGE